MRGHDRREFIKRLAIGAAYAAPAVYSLTAPSDLAGQGMASKHMMDGGGGMMGGGGGMMGMAPGATPAPWDRPPPGA